MELIEGRAHARPSSRLRFAAVVMAVAVSVIAAGCRSPFDDSKQKASPERRPELGQPAEALEPGDPAAGAGGPSTSAPRGTATTVRPGAPTSAGSGGSGGSGATVAGGAATTQAGRAAVAARVLVSLDDRSGDAGIGAPAYIDVRRLEIADLGDDVRITVDLAAAVPTLRPREVMGIGIDMFRSTDQESDYQVFADGGAAGWAAYLQTPDGFVDYPGRFLLGNDRLVFEVPWSAVGGEKAFRTALFADWSSRDELVPHSAQDAAPDRGVTDVRPA